MTRSFLPIIALALAATSVARADEPATQRDTVAATHHARRGNVEARPRTRRRHAPPPPCYATPVTITRVEPGGEREPHSLSLSFCGGAPNVTAIDELSLLARARHTALPTRGDVRHYARDVRRHLADPSFVFADAMRLDAGLLTRVQAIADHFPGHAIEVISGFRPRERDASRHRHGRALDLRVVGVSRERLRDFARTLPETGVGYYPNSVFVHVDVRDRKAYWIDRAGPGEPADYGVWPPSDAERHVALQRVLDSVDAALLTSP